MTRKEAINIMLQMIKDEEGFLSDNTVEAHKMAIKALDQEPRWIPISERLPEDKQTVIFTNKKNEIGLGIYHKGIGFLSDGVIAWMPLPKPYETQESEDKE